MIEDDDWSVEVVYLPRFDNDKTESDDDDKNIEIDNDESESNMEEDEDFYFESQEKVEKEPEVIKEETLSTVLIQHIDTDHEEVDWTTSTREDEQAFDEAEIETIPQFYEQRFVTRGSNDHSYLRKLVE